MGNMKFTQGECFSTTRYYSVFVDFGEGENEINATVVAVITDDDFSEYIEEITIINKEDIPEGYTEEQIILFIEQNFE